MRISNNMVYENFKNNQAKGSNNLYDINQQISSGRKIAYGYEDTLIYVDAMRLDHEEETLVQVSETSSKAALFSSNTDSALSDMTDTLERFKTKLIQAANGEHSETSLNAIATELESLKEHLVGIANTSINGQFLFSGTDVSTKPISQDGTYNGNSQDIKAIIGADVEVAYNINGADLFLGKDNDYHKKVSTNVKMLNQTLLNPDVMSNGGVAQEKYITQNDTIRDMVGDNNNPPNNSAEDETPTIFYITGRDTYGNALKKTIEAPADMKISEFLDKIGEAYGNSASDKFVDVELNNYGQIEITDTNAGSNFLEFHMFGAPKFEEPDDIIAKAESIKITEFIKSDFKVAGTFNTISATPDEHDASEFTLNTKLQRADGTEVLDTDLLNDVLNTRVDELVIFGTNTDGSKINGGFPLPFTIDDATTTVADLMSEIENNFGAAPGDVSVSLENGYIKIVDNTIDPAVTPTQESKMSINLTTSGVVPILLDPSGMDYDKAFFEKKDSLLTSNVSQIVKSTNEFATKETKLVDAAGADSLAPKTFTMPYKNINGVNGVAYIDLRNEANGGNVVRLDRDNDGSDDSTFSLLQYNKHYDKDSNINLDTIFNPHSVQELADSGTDPVPVSGVAYEPFKNGDEVKLDINGSEYFGNISTDADGVMRFSIDVSLADLQADPYSLTNKTDMAITTADEMTYAQFNDAISMVLSGSMPTDGDTVPDGIQLDEYNAAIKNAHSKVNVYLDERGRLNVKDNMNTTTKMELALFDRDSDNLTVDDSPALSFMANNAITIDDPNIDMFKDLDEIIDAVRNNKYRADADGNDPRNPGIQNAIAKMDHLIDHTIKRHTKTGTITNALQDSYDRSETLKINVMNVKSQVIDTDLAAALVEYEQYSTNYQATLSTISKISKLSLLNYM